MITVKPLLLLLLAVVPVGAARVGNSWTDAIWNWLGSWGRRRWQGREDSNEYC
jgi:hypothetical protein